LRERGFDPSYTGYGGGLDKSVQELATAQEKIKGKPRIDTEALKKKKGRGWLSSLTPDERQTIAAYGEYDAARENIASRAAETLNTPKGATMSRQEATRSAVDELARAQREQQYAAPATSTPESPVPAPVPAAVPSARTTPYQRATADVKAGDVKIEGLGYQNNAPEMSEAESTGYAKLESSMFPKGVEVGTRPQEKVRLESNMFPEGVEVAATTPSTAMAESPTPAAKPAIDEARMASLFRKTTGTDFNPKSRVDKERMAQLTSFIEEDPERLNKSDTKIALDFYRTL
jgi:hypothetical protein